MATSSVLFCLVVVLTFSATYLESVPSTYADPPLLVVEEVGSQGFVISWNKTGAWENVTDFDVTITTSTNRTCNTSVQCFTTDPCTFNSSITCAQLGTCKEVEIIVEGNNISAYLNITTAPPAVISTTTLSVNGTSAILSWKNYAEAECHDITRVIFITENAEYIYEVLSSTNEKTLNLSACDYGIVESFVQTVGGSGESAFRNNSTNFSADDAGPLLSDLTLSPGNDTLDVSWTLSTDNCPRLKTYLITWDPDNETGVNVGAEDRQYIIEGLIPCSEYNVTLQGLEANNITLSSPSSANSSTNIIVLDPPTAFDVNETQDTNLKVTWTPPEAFGPLCALQNYTVTWKADDLENFKVVNASETSYQITNLVPCTSYEIQISVGNTAGYSRNESTSSATNLTVLQAPGNPMVNDTQTTTIQVTWTRPEGYGPLCPLENYTVSWSANDTVGDEQIDVITDLEEYNITDLIPCTTYKIEIQAENTAGPSEAAFVEGNTDTEVLKPPTNLKSDNVTHDSFRLEWTSQEYGPLCPLTNYSISWASSVDYNDTGSDILDQNSVDYTIGDLSACTPYNVVIKSNNSEGFSDPADIQVITTASIPVAPVVYCYEATNGTNLVVEWTKPPKTNCIQDYEVRYSGDVLWSTEVTQNIEYVNGLDINLQNLTPWTNYTMCVAGRIQDGTLGDGDFCDMTTLEGRPGPPASINETSSDRKSISLEWEAPTEVNGNLLGYQLSWGNNKLNLTANDTSVLISNLKSRSDYTFTLQARTGPGLGAGIAIVVSTGGSNVVAIVLGILGGLAFMVIIIIAVMKRERIARISRREVQRVRSRRNTKRAATEMSERKTISTTKAFSPFQVTVNAIYKKDLRQYIVDLEADSQAGLEREFNELRDMSPELSTAIAKENYNRPKNRFINILPYDHARVILQEVPGRAGSDFINASYIKDYYGEKRFVATQGPKNNTNDDFWRMVWELNVSTIVMLTKMMEKGRDKCSKYWPDVSDGIVTFDDFQICNHNQDRGALFTTSYLEIQRGQRKKMLKHFHFTAWPDFGVPQHEDLLLDFMRKIKSLTSSTKNPMVIHCSAGVGRTGTFISLWNLIEYVKNEPHNPQINIKKAVLEMRQCRPVMVQSQDQYLYLCKCIAKYMENPSYWNKLDDDDDHIYDNATFMDDNIYENI